MFTRLEPGLQQWIKTCKGEADQPTGNFLEANTISEMANLAFVALRAGKKVEYDTNAMKITNDPAANEYLTRKYRKGWEL